jgi:hypothetical protein
MIGAALKFNARPAMIGTILTTRSAVFGKPGHRAVEFGHLAR